MADLAGLNARIAALEAEAERALDLASATALGKPAPAGFRLTTCAEWRAIQAELAPLRAARSAALPSPARSAAPPISRIATMSTDTRTREAKIQAIAAGLPVPIPAEMVDAAIANGHSVEAFAIAAADYAAAERARISQDAEVEAAVASILGYVPTASRASVKRAEPDNRTLDRAVADILAA